MSRAPAAYRSRRLLVDGLGLAGTPVLGQAAKPAHRRLLYQLQDHQQRLAVRWHDLAVRQRAASMLPAAKLFVGQIQGDFVRPIVESGHLSLRLDQGRYSAHVSKV